MALRIVAALVILAAALSCAARGDGKGLLDPANPATFKPSSYEPERPFVAQADGALARPVYRTESAAPLGKNADGAAGSGGSIPPKCPAARSFAMNAGS